MISFEVLEMIIVVVLFLIGVHKAKQPLQDMVLLENEEQKNEEYSRELCRKKPKKKVLINSRLKAI